ncbi:MAG: GFA family protein [Caulobacteraceae bacterium]|nr:MAG: GFA family protein [Caulobacteraceae bacterium]
MTQTPRTGGCRCGQVRFEITAPPILTMACHCRGCQRMTGGPYSLSMAVPPAGFAVTQGEPVIGGVGVPPIHFHCPHCLSWLFTRPQGAPFVNVRTPMLDDPSRLEPFLETYASTAFPWAKTGAPHSFDEFPPMEAYQALTEAFAATRGG